MLYSSNGKVIYCVSPDYLYALDRESKPYGFSIQGYSRLRQAIERLYTVNIKDIYGFMYVSDFLPRDTKNLDIFIRKLENVIPGNEEKVLLLVVRDKDGLLEYLQRIPKGKLRVMYISGFEAFNDIVFRQAFGTLLKENLTEYIEDEEKKTYYNQDIDYIHYENLLDRRLTSVLAPVKFYKTQKDTILRDKVLNDIMDRSNLFYKLRKCYLLAQYGKFVDISPLIEEAPLGCVIQLKVIERTIKKLCQQGGSIDAQR